MKISFTNKEPLEIKQSALAAGDVLPGVQISPIGDFPHGQTLQHVSEEAVRRMISAWQESGSKEILCDFEHRSEDGGSSDTSAAAWISNLALDPERGLVGDFKFTDVGAEAVSSRRLRFLSPVWECEVTKWIDEKRGIPSEIEPTELVSVALTNTPNLPVAPVLNKEQPENTNVEEKDNPNMDKIKEALGLAPEATEEDILNAINAMAQKNKEAEAAALDKEAEEFAEQNSKKCNKEVLKAQYLANKDVAKALVAGIPDAPAAQQQLLNKGTAQAPAKPDLVKELNKLPAGQARIKFVTEHAAEFADAAK